MGICWYRNVNQNAFSRMPGSQSGANAPVLPGHSTTPTTVADQFSRIGGEQRHVSRPAVRVHDGGRTRTDAGALQPAAGLRSPSYSLNLAKG
jgi:hypothetical protein